MYRGAMAVTSPRCPNRPKSGTLTRQLSAPVGTLEDAPWGGTRTVLPDGRVLLVGTSKEGEDPVGAVGIWDPQAASLTLTGPLEAPRMSHSATLLPDGRVLVVGGFGSGGTVASAELWDASVMSFMPAGSLAQPRAHHTATLLPDGRVLVVGGQGDEDDFFASAELWEPAPATR